MVLVLDFFGQKPLFWPTLIFKICIGNSNFKKVGYARNDTSNHKDLILRPLYTRYFWHITNIKWSHICQNSIRKCFLETFFQNIHFLFYFPLWLFEHYVKVNEWSKRVSKGFFLDLITFLTHLNIRPNECLKSIFLCTTILLY